MNSKRGLSRREAQVLELLEQSGERRSVDLEQRLGGVVAQMGTMRKRLLARGYVCARREHNPRGVDWAVLSISDAGREALQAYRAFHAELKAAAEAGEEWRPIAGSYGREVSSWGRVRSFVGIGGDPVRGERPHELQADPILLRGGLNGALATVSLGVGVGRMVSHIVLEAFVGPRPRGMQARFKDGDTSNLRAENLEWAKPSGARNPVRGEQAWARLHPELVPKGSRRTNSKLNESKVMSARAERRRGDSWPVLAKRYRVSRSGIEQAVTGQTWSHVPGAVTV